MKRVKIVKVPLYFQTLKIVVHKRLPKPEYAAYVLFKKNKIEVHLTNEVNAGIIAHEAVHIANYIFKEAYVELDIDNDEPYAYLLEWIVNKISKQVYTKKDISQFK